MCPRSIEDLKTLREEWAELRALLLSPEQQRLDELCERIDHITIRAEDVSRVLPEAVAQRGHGDEAFAEALAPHVEAAVATSLRQSPHLISNALATALRMAIDRMAWRAADAALRLPFPGLRKRGDRAIGNLRYNVDHVLLLHRGTGVLLYHVAADAEAARQSNELLHLATTIYTILDHTASSPHRSGFESRPMDNRLIWMVHGPRAALAAVIRGVPPKRLRSILQQSLLRIETEHADALSLFNGYDCHAFETTQPVLESCLLSEPSYASYDGRRRRLFAMLGSISLILAMSLLIWTWNSSLEDRRWNELLTALRAEPGIAVTSATRSGGRYTLVGLRDPLSRDPTTLLTQAGYTSEDVALHFSPYFSLDRQLIARRAMSVLQPPDRVSLDIDGTTLVLSGPADEEWAKEAKRSALFIPGVTSVDASKLQVLSAPDLIGRIERLFIPFASGSSHIAPEDQPKIDTLLTLLRDLDDVAVRSRKTVVVEVIGTPDESGLETMGLLLGTARAHAVLSSLGGKTLGRATRLTTGVEAPFPARARARHKTPSFGRATLMVKLVRAD